MLPRHLEYGAASVRARCGCDDEGECAKCAPRNVAQEDREAAEREVAADHEWTEEMEGES